MDKCVLAKIKHQYIKCISNFLNSSGTVQTHTHIWNIFQSTLTLKLHYIKPCVSVCQYPQTEIQLLLWTRLVLLATNISKATSQLVTDNSDSHSIPLECTVPRRVKPKLVVLVCNVLVFCFHTLYLQQWTQSWKWPHNVWMTTQLAILHVSGFLLHLAKHVHVSILHFGLKTPKEQPQYMPVT